jgi:hypothetical protein
MSSDLPTPNDISHDLQRIVHNLDEFWSLRLDGLAVLPTVQAWRPPAGTRRIETEGERRAYAIEDLVTALIPQQPYKEDREALAAIFTFDDPGASVKSRHEVAAKALGVTEASVRIKAEKTLLDKLAIDIYRAQLGWCMRQIDVERLDVHTAARTRWWSIVEIDWAVEIDGSKPESEVWEIKHVLRCVAPVAQPVLALTMTWTGSGPQEMSEVEVLSGPKTGDHDVGFPHKLLSLRPASPSAVADTAYIWDLGNPLLAGDEVELVWRQTLRDRAKTGLPFIGISTSPKPDLRAVRLRARIPDSRAKNPRAELHAENPMVTNSSYVAPWVKLLETQPLAPDDTGYYTYKPNAITIGHCYELWWGPRPEVGGA